MKVEVQRTALLGLLGAMVAAVPSRATLPAITNILLKADEKGLTGTGYNLETAVVKSCEAKVEKTGAVCVQPKPLLKFLQAVKAENVALTGAKLRQTFSLTVEANGAKAILEAMDPQDYPPAPEVKSKKTALVTDLTVALKWVQHAIAPEDSRPILAGVFLDPIEGGLNVVAADGFRLVMAPVQVSGEIERAIIPRQTVAVLIKLMNGSSVKVRRDEKLIAFEANGLSVVARPIQGTFPDYTKLIPDATKGTALTVDADELKRALAVVTATDPDSGIVRLQTKGDTLVLTVKSGDATLSASLPAKGEIMIALNEKYLEDMLAPLTGPVTFKTTSPSSPALVVHGGVVEVIMPMFVQW